MNYGSLRAAPPEQYHHESSLMRKCALKKLSVQIETDTEDGRTGQETGSQSGSLHRYFCYSGGDYDFVDNLIEHFRDDHVLSLDQHRLERQKIKSTCTNKKPYMAKKWLESSTMWKKGLYFLSKKKLFLGQVSGL